MHLFIISHSRAVSAIKGEKYKKESNDLYNRIADALAINEDHQKLNGKLQTRTTELEEDNKRLSQQIGDKNNSLFYYKKSKEFDPPISGIDDLTTFPPTISPNS